MQCQCSFPYLLCSCCSRKDYLWFHALTVMNLCAQTAVKEERREARASKKALKVRYKDETQRAQHGAAHTGPSGIHLP